MLRLLDSAGRNPVDKRSRLSAITRGSLIPRLAHRIARLLTLCAITTFPVIVYSQSCTITDWGKGADGRLAANCVASPSFQSPAPVIACVVAWQNLNSEPGSLPTTYSNLTINYSNPNLLTASADCIPTPFFNCSAFLAQQSKMTATGAQCAANPASQKDVGRSCQPANLCGEPIVLGIGNKILEEPDFIAPGANSLKFVRFYNSSPIAASAMPFAQAWMHNYGMFLNLVSATSVVANRADGKGFNFNAVGGSWVSDADVNDQLVKLTSGTVVTGWQYTNALDDSLETYDALGNLTSISYREGTGVTLSYLTGIHPPQLCQPLYSLSLTPLARN